MIIDRVVVWFSAGVTSAVAAKLTIDKYIDRYPVVLVHTDTSTEHPDNYRFIKDCENWLGGASVHHLRNPNYKDVNEVYTKDRWLVGPAGARCSLMMKKEMRRQFQNIDTDLQIFGFDYNEIDRAKRFMENNPLVNVEFPLIDNKITKMMARQMLLAENIKEPVTYSLGFKNANCLDPERGGCVKGGMGYWNHVRKHFPVAFWNKARIERELDIAICKTYKNGKRIRVFLDELPEDAGRYKSEPAIQCGLFCGE